MQYFPLYKSQVKLCISKDSESYVLISFRLAPVMSSEEKRIKTRKDIMENESIFTPLKSNSPSSASTMANNSTKAKKIENFKKVSMYEKFALSNVSQF